MRTIQTQRVSTPVMLKDILFELESGKVINLYALPFPLSMGSEKMRTKIAEIYCSALPTILKGTSREQKHLLGYAGRCIQQQKTENFFRSTTYKRLIQSATDNA